MQSTNKHLCVAPQAMLAMEEKRADNNAAACLPAGTRGV